MKEQIQRQNSDQADKQFGSTVLLSADALSKQSQVRSSLTALFFKSMTLQSRNYCTNLCQIVTPVLCLLFTLAVREIVNGVTTGAVKSFDFPQPFNMPLLNSIIRPQVGFGCGEIYYYEGSQSNEKWINKILDMQLKEMCPNTNQLSPKFIKKESVDKGIMEILKQADVTAFERGEDLITPIPDGLIKFKEADKSTMIATIGINDFRLPQYHKNNGVTKMVVKTSVTSTISTYLKVTEGMMSLIDKITRPFLQLSSPKQIISGFFMYMPFSGEDKSFINKMVNILGSGLYPLGLSLLLPLFLYMVVSEKEERQLQIMKMNGLNIKYYWVNFFIVSFILEMITSINMYIMGTYVIELSFFTNTSGAIIWITFVSWGIAQIAMTSFFQIFIDSSKSATIIGYILSIFSTLIGVTICTTIYPQPMIMPTALLLYPPFALCRVIFHIGLACADSRQCYSSIWDLDPEAVKCIIILFAWFFMYIASIWLSQMVQQEFGVAKRPKFIEEISKKLFKKKKYNTLIQDDDLVTSKNDPNTIQMGRIQSVGSINHEDRIDQSVNQHKREVANSNVNNEPLIIIDVSKKYETDNGQKERIALKPLSLKLIKGEIFGFLGPNGAGKTTLISVLTGMYPQTSGNAWISGLQIGNSQTNSLIGVCPQFDILWPDLTVQEHLLFYCRLKQINPLEIENRVKQSLEDVDLTSSKDLRSKQLSGGMQRRLSIAIALVGNPSVVFLDEPSSGLDPYHRRQIWNILMKCKNKTSIFMTSHLMDQVEYLCDRIGIISQGQLRCVGDINHLKQKYGKGYRLTISYHNLLKSENLGSNRPQIVNKIIQKFNFQIVNQLQTRIILQISKADIKRCAQWLRQDDSLIWSINQPSLYDLFMYFVK